MENDVPELVDVVFTEHYARRTLIALENAHKEGQAVGIRTMLVLMKEFEVQGISCTASGMLEYLEDMGFKPKDMGNVE